MESKKTPMAMILDQSVASVTVIEVWDKRDWHNISRRIEYPNGDVEWLEPYSPGYRPFHILEQIKPEQQCTCDMKEGIYCPVHRNEYLLK